MCRKAKEHGGITYLRFSRSLHCVALNPLSEAIRFLLQNLRYNSERKKLQISDVRFGEDCKSTVTKPFRGS